mmetsp:Transcript_23276/g.48311  ORF Transcript_23276/g.48311 Transcript_23276/m.48311 type:complete len:263 (+) Transcript_23276:990-1778(+)
MLREIQGPTDLTALDLLLPTLIRFSPILRHCQMRHREGAEATSLVAQEFLGQAHEYFHLRLSPCRQTHPVPRHARGKAQGLQCHSQVVAVVLRQGTIHVDRQLWALPVRRRCRADGLQRVFPQQLQHAAFHRGAGVFGDLVRSLVTSVVLEFHRQNGISQDVLQDRQGLLGMLRGRLLLLTLRTRPGQVQLALARTVRQRVPRPPQAALPGLAEGAMALLQPRRVAQSHRRGISSRCTIDSRPNHCQQKGNTAPNTQRQKST